MTSHIFDQLSVTAVNNTDSQKQRCRDKYFSKNIFSAKFVSKWVSFYRCHFNDLKGKKKAFYLLINQMSMLSMTGFCSVSVSTVVTS